jgi:hypothetical protein
MESLYFPSDTPQEVIRTVEKVRRDRNYSHESILAYSGSFG